MHTYLRIFTYVYAYNTHTYIWDKSKVEPMYVEKQDKQMRAGRTKQIPLGISTVSKEEGCVCMKMS